MLKSLRAFGSAQAGAHALVAVALSLGTGSLWLLLNLLLVAAFYLPSARAEERALLILHPGYRAYMARTGRFLPRLRRA